MLARLRRRRRISRAVVFGSMARGDYNDASDIDLIVVGDFEQRYVDRVGEVLECYKGKRDLEPWAYTEEEFERMLREGRAFLEHALGEGIEIT